jgi:hypothetical protein
MNTAEVEKMVKKRNIRGLHCSMVFIAAETE